MIAIFVPWTDGTWGPRDLGKGEVVRGTRFLFIDVPLSFICVCVAILFWFVNCDATVATVYHAPRFFRTLQVRPWGLGDIAASVGRLQNAKGRLDKAEGCAAAIQRKEERKKGTETKLRCA